jgi:RNA polymerase sigma-B factor
VGVVLIVAGYTGRDGPSDWGEGVVLGERTISDEERTRRTAQAAAELQTCLDAASADPELPGLREQERRAREELVLANTAVATSIAYRYRNSGEPMEELVQTACVGLVKAANGFVPGRGSDFLAYAVPTIAGEVKRYFRDSGWAVRPPRRLQELHLAISRVRPDLEARLGRSPTVSELAAELGVDQEDVIETLASEQGYRTVSLDAPTPSSGGEPGGATLADGLSCQDDGFQAIEDVMSVRPLLDALSPRERRILALRFFDELTQQQIGERVGVTQMQVSRLLTKSLDRLREGLAAAS